ncbi:MAG: DUF4230 domain-containing protein [Bacteroidales bacterium]|nr:DUF4230 domain-containing protein [Bacteroidales bacterium]
MNEKSFRLLIRAAELILVVLGILLVLQVVGSLRGGGMSRRGLKAQDTQTIVTQVQAMASFVTASYYDEVVLTASKPRTAGAFTRSIPLPDDEICIISHGKARAGIDLSKLSEDAFSMQGDTVMVRLPEPELFEIILNPSDYEIFVEDGRWSHEEVVAIESRAKEAIRRDALAAGLLDKAAESAGKQLDRLLRSFGYKEVVVVPHSLPLPAGEKL